MATIGKQLSNARKKLGLSIEDIVHATKINSNVIRSIEEDDFSLFPSTTYARSFLRKYSEHLQIDVSEEIQALQEGTEVSLKNTAVMEEIRDTLQNNKELRIKQPRRFRHKVEKPGGAPMFLGFILALLFVSFGVFYFLGYNAESPEEVKEEISKNLSKASDLLKEGRPDELASANPPLTENGIEANPLNGSRKGEKSEPLGDAEKSVSESEKELEKQEQPAIQKPEVAIRLRETPLDAEGSPKKNPNQDGTLKPRREMPAIKIEDPDQPELSSEDLPNLPGVETDDEPQIRSEVEGPPLQLRPQASESENQESDENGNPDVRAVPVTAGTR